MKQLGWPVLTYHVVDPLLADRNSVHPSQLAQQLDTFLERGFVFVSLDDLYSSLITQDYQMSGVLVTFDDGYEAVLEYAFDLLKERNIPFTVFVPVEHVGRTNLWNPKARYLCKHLSWDALCFLARDELATIGSHAYSHQSLVKFRSDTVEDELVRSKSELEDKLGVAVDYIAYPYGDVNKMIEAVASKFYHLGFSATQGSWSWSNRPWAINRVLVTSSDSSISIVKTIEELYPLTSSSDSV